MAGDAQQGGRPSSGPGAVRKDDGPIPQKPKDKVGLGVIRGDDDKYYIVACNWVPDTQDPNKGKWSDYVTKAVVSDQSEAYLQLLDYQKKYTDDGKDVSFTDAAKTIMSAGSSQLQRDTTQDKIDEGVRKQMEKYQSLSPKNLWAEHRKYHLDHDARNGVVGNDLLPNYDRTADYDYDLKRFDTLIGKQQETLDSNVDNYKRRDALVELNRLKTQKEAYIESYNKWNAFGNVDNSRYIQELDAQRRISAELQTRMQQPGVSPTAYDYLYQNYLRSVEKENAIWAKMLGPKAAPKPDAPAPTVPTPPPGALKQDDKPLGLPQQPMTDANAIETERLARMADRLNSQRWYRASTGVIDASGQTLGKQQPAGSEQWQMPQTIDQKQHAQNMQLEGYTNRAERERQAYERQRRSGLFSDIQQFQQLDKERMNHAQYLQQQLINFNEFHVPAKKLDLIQKIMAQEGTNWRTLFMAASILVPHFRFPNNIEAFLGDIFAEPTGPGTQLHSAVQQALGNFGASTTVGKGNAEYKRY